MPGTYAYPGVYIEEIPSGVRTIVGVSTSNAAFVDFFKRGPMNEPVRITGMGDFERVFGGLDSRSEASYAIQQFYRNGGGVAFVVRVAGGTPTAASRTLQGGSPPQDTMTVAAASEGVWGDNVQVGVDYKASEPDQFNLVAREVETDSRGGKRVTRSETYRNLTMDQTKSSYAISSVNEGPSALVKLADDSLGQRPASTAADITRPDVASDPDSTAFVYLGKEGGNAGSDGSEPDGAALAGTEADRTGIYALDTITPAIFNILCLPAAANLTAGMTAVISEATVYCEKKRAFLIIDIPESENTPTKAVTWMTANDGLRHQNAAVYFPRLTIADRLNGDRPRNVGASGTLAGIYARTDAERGVWKAPAGTEADLRGVRSLAVKINDLENGQLNPLGINALRTFPIIGSVSWGARTLDGADLLASEWKYVSVRRTALFIEESLWRASQWIVFEPNDEPLWAQIRLNIGAFMHNLFRQGAFQGTTPRDAYFVKCDSETTTQNDINLGIVNIVVGFAPLKPAEFVVIKIQQMAGQVEA